MAVKTHAKNWSLTLFCTPPPKLKYWWWTYGVSNSNRQWKSYDSIKKGVLYGYPGTDFEADEKPKWGPLEIEFFLLRRVNERS